MNVLKKEQIRNQRMINEYIKELDLLPKGKIVPKSIKGNIYYYLYYREGKKVISKYVGKNEDSLKNVREQLERRNQIEMMIKMLKEEQIKIKKLEGLL